jgi:type IV pilus assembly protein PilN
MIKINLLAVERKHAKKKIALPFTINLAGQSLAIACGGILVATLLFIGWQYLGVRRVSAQLDADIAAAQQETTRLHSIIQQVQQFEQRKTQLQQRVSLIEQLRKDQTGPVHMLDQISRALPPLLWLTDLRQTPVLNEVLVDGRCTTLTGLSDFVTNLEASGYFKKSVEIVSTRAEPQAGAAGEIVTFTIKAQFQRPEGAKPVAAAAVATTAGT